MYGEPAWLHLWINKYGNMAGLICLTVDREAREYAVKLFRERPLTF